MALSQKGPSLSKSAYPQLGMLHPLFKWHAFPSYGVDTTNGCPTLIFLLRPNWYGPSLLLCSQNMGRVRKTDACRNSHEKSTAHSFSSELGGNIWHLMCRCNAVTHTNSQTVAYAILHTPVTPWLWVWSPGSWNPLQMTAQSSLLSSVTSAQTEYSLIQCAVLVECVCVGGGGGYGLRVRLVNQQKETKQATDSNFWRISNIVTLWMWLHFIHSSVFGLTSPAAEQVVCFGITTSHKLAHTTSSIPLHACCTRMTKLSVWRKKKKQQPQP